MENNPANHQDLFQVNPRDRLFYTIFVKVGQMYSRSVPPWFRTLIEVLLLIKAVSLFTMLSYIHYSFSKYPIDCLGDTKYHWPRDGILRLQILPSEDKFRDYTSSMSRLYVNDSRHLSNRSSLQDHNLKEFDWEFVFSDFEKAYSNILKKASSYTPMNSSLTNRTAGAIEFAYIESALQGVKQIKEQSAMEYALEYGFLTLSKETRDKLKVPIKVVYLDPAVDKCFGDGLSRLILDRFLGYDDILMSSIKRIAEVENNQGYMKNCRTGEHYHFVTMWMGRSSYFVALILMFVFTISISTLLRFCHQQIFIFIVHVLQIMEWNAAAAFPAASLFTVILSLVGMEAIMSEFFNDTTTSFYVILIVWSADQYDSICCHTTVSQKHWLKFFYLYHFFFYAYHYRFNGQYSSVALATSWFFIQHSMLYFFHNYELPVIESQVDQQRQRANDVYFDDAILMLFDDLGQGLPYGGANPAHQATNNNDEGQDNNLEVDEEDVEGNVDNIVGDGHQDTGDESGAPGVSPLRVESREEEAVVLPPQQCSSSDDLTLHNPHSEAVVLSSAVSAEPQSLDTEDVEFIDLTSSSRLSFDDD